MKSTHTAVCLLLLLSSGLVTAQEKSQWKSTKLSLHDLTHDGYTIVSVTSDAGGSNQFFLQKGTEVAKCLEGHIDDPRAKTQTTFLWCWQLMRPS